MAWYFVTGLAVEPSSLILLHQLRLKAITSASLGTSSAWPSPISLSLEWQVRARPTTFSDVFWIRNLSRVATHLILLVLVFVESMLFKKPKAPLFHHYRRRRRRHQSINSMQAHSATGTRYKVKV